MVVYGVSRTLIGIRSVSTFPTRSVLTFPTAPLLRSVITSPTSKIGSIGRRSVPTCPIRSVSTFPADPSTSFEETRIVNFENGSKWPRIFSDEEYASRLSKLRSHMTSHNIDACLFTSLHNVAYYSNFLYCSFGRPYGLVVTPESAVTISALIDAGQPWRRSVDDNVVYTDWRRDNFFHAVDEVIGNKRAVVGVEMDHVTWQTREKLKAILPTMVDVSEATMKMRMIKSEEEIRVIRAGASVADVGGFAVRAAVEEGVPEFEIALSGTAAMVREIGRRFGPETDIRDTWVWFQSGINTDGAHNPGTTRRLRNGDILSVNCFPMIHGYYTALERTMFLGHASDEHLKYWEANVEVHKKGLELIKPGVRCCDIAAELNAVFASHGLLHNRTFGYGHSFGVLCHYYGREAGLELREDIDTVLEPGMVVSMEPMITVPEGRPGAGGYREHDIIVIGHDGKTENITKFPFGPEHNIVSPGRRI